MRIYDQIVLVLAVFPVLVQSLLAYICMIVMSLLVTASVDQTVMQFCSWHSITGL